LFSERLKQIRTRLGLSQVELAERAEVTAAAISLYESGKRKPSFAISRKISQVLGVGLEDLWGEENEGKDVADPKLRLAFRKMQNLDLEDRKAVEVIIAKLSQKSQQRKR